MCSLWRLSAVSSIDKKELFDFILFSISAFFLLNYLILYTQLLCTYICQPKTSKRLFSISREMTKRLYWEFQSCPVFWISGLQSGVCKAIHWVVSGPLANKYCIILSFLGLYFHVCLIMPTIHVNVFSTCE